MQVDKTLEYYERNAAEFIAGTVDAEMSDLYRRFEKYLSERAHVLDFGCGSGRDTKHFLSRGYYVTAIDGSTELCTAAAKMTGIPVQQILFEDFAEINTYDAVWACASILHLPRAHLKKVMQALAESLRKNGVLYTSFKYGTFAGYRNGRWFSDFTENTMDAFLSDLSRYTLLEQWITADVRAGRGEEKWLNLILRKKGPSNNASTSNSTPSEPNSDTCQHEWNF